MKFMDQVLFEILALTFTGASFSDQETYYEFTKSMYNSHKDMYSGDNLWYNQVVEMSEHIKNLVEKAQIREEMLYLKIATDLRGQLDENLNARSTIKKIFGGSLFQKSHPSPSDRITIAKKIFQCYLF